MQEFADAMNVLSGNKGKVAYLETPYIPHGIILAGSMVGFEKKVEDAVRHAFEFCKIQQLDSSILPISFLFMYVKISSVLLLTMACCNGRKTKNTAVPGFIRSIYMAKSTASYEYSHNYE